MTTYNLSDKDIGQIIAGLRMLQDPTNPDVHDIVTNGGEFGYPTDAELDALCERLNMPDIEPPVRLWVTIEGGVVQSIYSDSCEVMPLVVDYDTEGGDADDVGEVQQENEVWAPAFINGWDVQAIFPFPAIKLDANQQQDLA